MKVYDEKAALFGTAEGLLQCVVFTHVYASDSPEDNDVCACGKFYFAGAKNDQASKAPQG